MSIVFLLAAATAASAQSAANAATSTAQPVERGDIVTVNDRRFLIVEASDGLVLDRNGRTYRLPPLDEGVYAVDDSGIVVADADTGAVRGRVSILD